MKKSFFICLMCLMLVACGFSAMSRADTAYAADDVIISNGGSVPDNDNPLTNDKPTAEYGGKSEDTFAIVLFSLSLTLLAAYGAIVTVRLLGGKKKKEAKNEKE